MRLVEILRDQWPRKNDPSVSRLIVTMESPLPVFQNYTQEEKQKLVNLSNDVYYKLTQGLYEHSGSHTRTQSTFFGFPKGMVYDTSRVLALFIVMMRKLDTYVESETIDDYASHLRALQRARAWAEKLYREHVESLRVSRRIC